ncbi:MAG: hypothetical protein IKL66_04035 [Clostridia bacterium]|nr:hypothetical protein [Clostridia bacterium]
MSRTVKSATDRASHKSNVHPMLSLSRTIAKEAFGDRSRPWEAIFNISSYISEHGSKLPYDQYDEIAENVWVHVSAYLAPTAKIEAPAIICGGARICNHTVVEHSIIGSFCTVGEMSTVKNSVTFDRSRLCGHNSLSYSVLGYEAILGEGTMVSDTRLDALNVSINMPDGTYFSGRSHLGAVICDGARVGASCVVNPGSVIDSNALIYPLSSVSGYVRPYSNVK